MIVKWVTYNQDRIASFLGFSCFVLLFAFTIIHANGRVKNGGGLGLWLRVGYIYIDLSYIEL